MCETYKIHVSNAGVFILAQTSVGVLPGKQICGFGLGGFRPPAEIQDLCAEGGYLKDVQSCAMTLFASQHNRQQIYRHQLHGFPDLGRKDRG